MPDDRACCRCGAPLDDVDRLLAVVDPGSGGLLCAACVDRSAEAASGGAAPEELTGLATIGVRELRNQVAAVVRRAAAGERIIVSVDGRPMAQLGPITAPGAPTLADLAAAGLVEPPRTAAAAAPAAEDLAVDVRLDRVLEELRGR